MTARFIDLDTGAVHETADREFFERVFGHPPKVVDAETQARRARNRLAETIARAEYAKARNEREALIRKCCVEGVSVDLNAPLERAKQRIRERIAEIDRRAAA